MDIIALIEEGLKEYAKGLRFMERADILMQPEDMNEPERPYTVINGVALYKISGAMFSEVHGWRKKYVVGYNVLSDVFAQMQADEEVEKVLLMVDTPGGAVAGISDVTAAFDRLNAAKPVTVHTKRMLASAGVWIFSGASEIVASETAKVGSVGVLVVHGSMEKLLKEAGIKVTVIKSADKKAVGGPYKDLSEKDKKLLQAKVDEVATLFQDRVRVTREDVAEDVWSGDVFLAGQAKRFGLVDRVGVFSDTFVRMVGDAETSSSDMASALDMALDEGPGFAGLSAMMDIGGSMKKKVTAEMFEAAVASGADPETMEIVSDDAYAATKDEGGADEPASAVAEVNTEGQRGDSEESAEGSLQIELEDALHSLAMVELERNELKARVEELEQRVEEADTDPLRMIAVDRIKTMRIALGMAAVDMAEFPVASLVAEYKALDKEFKKSFRAGGVGPGKETEEKKEAKVTSIEKARLRAVGI